MVKLAIKWLEKAILNLGGNVKDDFPAFLTGKTYNSHRTLKEVGERGTDRLPPEKGRTEQLTARRRLDPARNLGSQEEPIGYRGPGDHFKTLLAGWIT